MPHKFNAARRDKIPKQKHCVTNWPEYNESIGPKLKARTFENQKTEAKIGVRILIPMTGLDHPSFERAA